MRYELVVVIYTERPWRDEEQHALLAVINSTLDRACPDRTTEEPPGRVVDIHVRPAPSVCSACRRPLDYALNGRLQGKCYACSDHAVTALPSVSVEKSTAWTADERAALTAQKERDNADAYQKGPDGKPLRVFVPRPPAPDACTWCHGSGLDTACTPACTHCEGTGREP